MRLIFISILFLLGRNSLTFGQWTPINVGAFNNFFDVQFLNDSVGLISGSGGAIMKTIDYGNSWFNVNNTGSASTFKLHFPGDTIGYAVGMNNLYKSIDQGATWNSLPNVSTFDKSNIYFLNDTTGFFLAAYGIIFKTVDGGINWNNISTTCSRTIVEEDIYFTDQNTGYFGGWYGTCVSKTIDGGITWQILTSNLLYVIKSIHFPSSTTGYMAGWSSSPSYGVQKTTDGGLTWTLQTAPTGLLSIYCTDTANCYAVGINGLIIKTTDGGLNWQQQISGTANGLRKIYCTDANTCYAVGDSGTILKTVNGGLTSTLFDQSGNNNFKISPNPANERINLDISLRNYEIEINDTQGKQIMFLKNQNQIDVSTLSNGIYFIRILSEASYTHEKLVISHQ